MHPYKLPSRQYSCTVGCCLNPPLYRTVSSKQTKFSIHSRVDPELQVITKVGSVYVLSLVHLPPFPKSQHPGAAEIAGALEELLEGIFGAPLEDVRVVLEVLDWIFMLANGGGVDGLLLVESEIDDIKTLDVVRGVEDMEDRPLFVRLEEDVPVGLTTRGEDDAGLKQYAPNDGLHPVQVRKVVLSLTSMTVHT